MLASTEKVASADDLTIRLEPIPQRFEGCVLLSSNSLRFTWNFEDFGP